MTVFQLSQEILFPPPELAEPDGLIAIGGDLSPERLVAAYREGIFPWFGEGEPILWWTPSPRLVLFPEEFHPGKRLLRTIRQGNFSVTADEAFHDVIHHCAGQRSPGRTETWITAEMIEAYKTLHETGYAHSIECWQDKKLVGGLYGIIMDRVFFGESMFSFVSNSSKVALFNLIRYATSGNIRLIDCQIRTDHLIRLGAREIPRSIFQQLLQQNISTAQPQKKWCLP